MAYDHHKTVAGDRSVTKAHIFRAGLEWNTQCFGIVNRPVFLTGLPIDIGPFRFALSPNALYYSAQMGWFQDHDFPSLDDPHPHQDYPNSIVYVETKVEADTGSNVEEQADRTFDQLEALLRLFSPGEIFLRRNISVGIPIGDDDLVWGAFIEYRPITPRPEPLYQRDPYRFDDETLGRLHDFFDLYWPVICQAHQPINNALYHFSSSYERRTETDRLIELMISMEALFGDREYHRYKIPLRCSCMLYPRGSQRRQAFTSIKKLYDARSRIIHGDTTELGADLEVEVKGFEEHVRRSILRFLELHNDGLCNLSGNQLDDLLFLTDV